MDSPQFEQSTCHTHTETPHSTSECPLLGLIANFGSILPESDRPVDDAENAIHQHLNEVCLRYQDAVKLSYLDS